MKRPVFIEYETKTREFDGRLLLISHLLNKGIENIFIGNKPGIKRESLYHKNGSYIAKSFTHEGLGFYKKLKEKGFSIILLHVEGGIFYKEIKETILSYFPEDLISLVSYNFVFGEYIKEAIKKHIESTDVYNKTIVSGEPRFDLLKSKYKSFYAKEVQEINKKYGEFILINTSFSVANPHSGKEQVRTFFMNNKSYTDEVKGRLLFKMDFLEDVLDSYLKAIKILSEEYKTKNFVIRPHPAESKKTYENYFSNTPNVFIDYSKNVVCWIHAAKGVIHYDCTTGMEAALANKPVISYLPKQSEKVNAWLPIAVSYNVTEPNHLLEAVNLIFENKFNHTISENILRKWRSIIYNVNGESSEIITNKLLGLQEEVPSVSFNIIAYIHLNYIRIKKYLAFLKNRYLIKTHVSILKDGTLTKKEIETKLNKLKAINKFNFNFTLNYQGHNVIRIKKK